MTVDGFVFRVDMRLRPFGDSGSLVASFEAMEDYYQTQGREWERYAMIKARPMTGSERDKKAISELLRPFVYRRYLDYGMFDSLREMKSMIAGQLHLKGMEDNIKLGAGDPGNRIYWTSVSAYLRRAGPGTTAKANFDHSGSAGATKIDVGLRRRGA